MRTNKDAIFDIAEDEDDIFEDPFVDFNSDESYFVNDNIASDFAVLHKNQDQDLKGQPNRILTLESCGLIDNKLLRDFYSQVTEILGVDISSQKQTSLKTMQDVSQEVCKELQLTGEDKKANRRGGAKRDKTLG